MQYTRPMIDLVYEIRRRVDAELKPGIKLANPEMLKELAEYYQHTKDTVSKALIKELLNLAGEEWLALLAPPKPEVIPSTPTRQLVKVYRGQTMLVEAAPLVDIQSEAPPRTLRMYRGHPVT